MAAERPGHLAEHGREHPWPGEGEALLRRVEGVLCGGMAQAVRGVRGGSISPFTTIVFGTLKNDKMCNAENLGVLNGGPRFPGKRVLFYVVCEHNENYQK